MRTPEEMVEQITQLVEVVSAAKYPRRQVRFPVTRDEAIDLRNHLRRKERRAYGEQDCVAWHGLELHGIRCSWGDVDFKEIL